jgi:hypothetical protein
MRRRSGWNRTRRAPIPVTPTTYPLLRVLEAAIQVYENDGRYISKEEAANNNTVCSASKILALVNSGYIATPAQIAETTEIIKKFADIDPKDNGYLIRVKADLNAAIAAVPSPEESTIKPNSLGVWAALPQIYSRMKKHEAENKVAAEQGKNSDYIGNVGDRKEYFVKLTDKKFFQKIGMEGCNIFFLIDRFGNVGLFYRNGDLTDEAGGAVNIGDCFLMKATIKDLRVSQFSGNKETVFNRVKILENKGQRK